MTAQSSKTNRTLEITNENRTENNTFLSDTRQHIPCCRVNYIITQ